MRERIDTAWRTLATGICFLGFGIGGLLLRFIVLPPLGWVERWTGREGELAKMSLHYVFRAFIEAMRLTGVLSYKLYDSHRLRRDGLLVLANHPSLIDIVFLIALIRRADCVVKSALQNNPATSGPIHAARYICNDAGLDVVDQCIASVKAQNSLVIFPEGTRTSRKPLTLLRGAAHVAIRGGLNITPVHIRCHPAVLRRGEPWHRVPRRRPHFDIRVGDDISVQPFVESHANTRAAAVTLTRFLTRYFREANDAHVGTGN